MDLNYRTNLLFPVPIHQFDVNGFSGIKDKLIDYAYDCKKNDPEGLSISNRGRWQSISLPFTNKNKKDVLQSFLTNCLEEIPPINRLI